jgi:hypothetical protein
MSVLRVHEADEGEEDSFRLCENVFVHFAGDTEAESMIWTIDPRLVNIV